MNFLANFQPNSFVDNTYIKVSTCLSIRNYQTDQSQEHKKYNHSRMGFPS